MQELWSRYVILYHRKPHEFSVLQRKLGEPCRFLEGVDAQFQKIPNFYEISCHICVDFFSRTRSSTLLKNKIEIGFHHESAI